MPSVNRLLPCMAVEVHIFKCRVSVCVTVVQIFNDCVSVFFQTM